MRSGIRAALCALWLATIASPAAAAFVDAAPPAAPPPGTVSEFALLAPLVSDELLAARGMTREKKKPKEPKPAKEPAAADSTAGADTAPPADDQRPRRSRRMGRLPGALSGDRARLMLQSLTVPGWGQATIGRRGSALAFGLAEVGIWGSFTAFRIQQHMRSGAYERTAHLFAGIDLEGRDEEYRRIIGLYLSSDEYNRLVVRRDAANLYYGDPVAYNAYIAEHEIRGAGAWTWASEDDLVRYRTERQAAQRASKHAQDALAMAVINRLLSVVHVARSHAPPATDRTSWRVECVPVGPDPTAFRLALRADF